MVVWLNVDITGWQTNAPQPRTAPPYRCGTLTHDYPLEALSGSVRASDWSGKLTWTEGGTAIIDGTKPESTYPKVKD